LSLGHQPSAAVLERGGNAEQSRGHQRGQGR
jgi:hypothetical protein